MFNRNETIWDCESETLSEGRAPESAYAFPNTHVDHEDRDGAPNPFGEVLKLHSTSSPLQKFWYYIEQAASRELSYEDDRIYCVTGLLSALQEDFRSGFFWGHPIDVLDCSLAFCYTYHHNAPFQRRKAFPSWCWAGHVAHLALSIAGPYDA